MKYYHLKDINGNYVAAVAINSDAVVSIANKRTDEFGQILCDVVSPEGEVLCLVQTSAEVDSFEEVTVGNFGIVPQVINNAPSAPTA